MKYYFTLVYKWVLDFLICYPFYKLHHFHFPIIGGTQSISGLEEDVECVVCLCKIQKPDETNNYTCPLCRESLRQKRAITKNGAEVLKFNFCAIRNDRDRDDWWLR